MARLKGRGCRVYFGMNFVIYGKLNLFHILMDTQAHLLFGSSEVTHFGG